MPDPKHGLRRKQRWRPIAVAGLSLDRPRIMGILNVTPDSFSDGGDRFDAGRAIADGLADEFPDLTGKVQGVVVQTIK